VNRGRSEEVGVALDLFPEHLRERLKFDVFCGDPVFAGVAYYGTGLGSDGRYYGTTAHVLYPERAHDGKTTIVLPEDIGLAFTVHELAHVLDLSFDFDLPVEPVTWYARRNRHEAFAEAVTALLVPGYPRTEGEAWGPPVAERAWKQRRLVEALELH
jgi:hypothetical protein